MTKQKLNSYVVLLRGINVGGNNIIRMADLRKLLQETGFQQIKTYIQSGNIVLESDYKQADQVQEIIFTALKQTLNKEIKILVIPEDEFEAVVAEAPRNFGSENEKYKYDVIFFFKSLSPKQAATEIELHEEVDKLWVGKQAIFFRRDAAKLTKSKLRKIVGTPNYKMMTIRNWRTTMRLFEMLHKQ